MRVDAVYTDHPEAPWIVPSAHCVQRFRQRMPIRQPGVDEVLTALRASLEAADIWAWAPGWAVSDRPAELWAVDGDIAYPLARTAQSGRWLAVTCLRRNS